MGRFQDITDDRLNKIPVAAVKSSANLTPGSLKKMLRKNGEMLEALRGLGVDLACFLLICILKFRLTFNGVMNNVFGAEP